MLPEVCLMHKFVLLVLSLAFLVSALAAETPKDLAASSCALSPNPYGIKAGGTGQFSVSCYNSAGQSIACPPLGWASTIGSVSQSGSFSAGTAAGSGTVTATEIIQGSELPPSSSAAVVPPHPFSCSLQVTVTAGNAASVQLSPPSASIDAGAGQQFSAKVYDSYGNQLANPPIAWSFSSSAVGSVSQTGFFSALNAGSGTLRAEYGFTDVYPKPSATAAITVTQSSQTQATTCAITPSEATLTVAQSKTFEVRCYKGGQQGKYTNQVACPQMEWSAQGGKMSPSRSASASLSELADFTAGTAAGPATVTAGEGGPSMRASTLTCTANIVLVPSTPESVSVSPSSASIYTDQSAQFAATAKDAYGNEISGVRYSWSVSPSPGSVDSSGKFSSATTGAYTVKAQVSAMLMSDEYTGEEDWVPAPPDSPYGTAAASVSAKPSGSGGTGVGGSGGSSTGGGPVSSYSQLSFTCAGKDATVKTTVFKPGATVQLDIIYMGKTPPEKVFSTTAQSDREVKFVPPYDGRYELRATVGVEQKNAEFAVPPCTPTTLNTTQNVSISLTPPEGPEGADTTGLGAGDGGNNGAQQGEKGWLDSLGLSNELAIALGVAVVLFVGAGALLLFGGKKE